MLAGARRSGRSSYAGQKIGGWDFPGNDSHDCAGSAHLRRGDGSLFSDLKLMGKLYWPNVGLMHVALRQGSGRRSSRSSSILRGSSRACGYISSCKMPGLSRAVLRSISCTWSSIGCPWTLISISSGEPTFGPCMQAARPGFERAVEACGEREGCQVRRAPGEHAGGKHRLRYLGGVGGFGSLEVDVNFVQRGPLFGVEERRPRFPSDGESRAVAVLTLEESGSPGWCIGS
jgi:hypothetical protein